MAKKASLFSGGNRSTSVTINNTQKKTVTNPILDISEEALLMRAEKRKVLPQHPLVFTCIGHEYHMAKEIYYDYSPLTECYPHHSSLINQLLVGVSLILTPQISTNGIRAAHNSIKLFIKFLNDKNSLNSTNVNYVANIDTFVLQAYKTYLVANYPQTSTSNLFYRNLVRSLAALRKQFPCDPSIGVATAVPRAPQKIFKTIEGYNRNQIKALIRCCIKDIKAIKAFHTAYDNLENDSPQLSTVPRGYNVAWKDNPDLRFMEILDTIKSKWPKYPYYMPMSSVQALFDVNKIDDEERDIRIRINTALQNCAGKISFMDGKLGRGAIFAAMHFVSDTIYPFLLLSLISTGFNAGCLKFLIDNLDEHVSEDMLDSKNFVIIWGYKGKTDRLIPVRCKKNQAFGAYRLLKYVESVILKYNDSPHYAKGSLFQFTRTILATTSDSKGLICTFHGDRARMTNMGKSFVKRHHLEKMFGSTVDPRKIRSGFASVAIEGGVTTSQIAEQFGHQDAQKVPETADKFYLSDTSSVAVKHKVIADIQKKLVTDTYYYTQRIVTSKTLQHLRDSINSAKNQVERNNKIQEASRELNLEEKTIVHLINARSQTYILACEDMANPTWPGNEEYLINGQCMQFNKCCMCRQAVIFPEALPYIAKRIIDVEEMQNTLTAIEWSVNFGDEHDAWCRILASWNNREQVEIAWRAAKNGEILLPKIMRGGTR